MFDRCREVQRNPNGYLDLWARDHRKSTTITFGLTIQDLLNNPELTVGIFSHTRPIAKSFLRQIKREFEGNALLKSVFPDILWDNPGKEAPKWSEDDGLILKRKRNPKESSVEAHGVVDGQPIGKHFELMVYDDIVTRESVSTPEMINKTTQSWELSLSLGTEFGRRRYIGTRYHYNDTYATIMQREAAKPRIYPATVDGTADGEPVLLKRETLIEKRKEQGIYTFSSQMLLNPIADESQGFKYEWVNFYEGKITGDGLNVYILIDPANSKKKSSDYTSMWVIGLGSDGNYYVLDMVRDRLNLTERGNILFGLHRKWRPLDVLYEEYGMQADITYLRERMGKENYHFNITSVKGKLSKVDRIRRLIPLYEQGKWWFPHTLYKTDYEHKTHELVGVFMNEELRPFPVSNHDDMLDAQSRICDVDLVWPRQAEDSRKKERYTFDKGKHTGWMAR